MPNSIQFLFSYCAMSWVMSYSVVAHQIDVCACNPQCYTNEVSDLSCRGKTISLKSQGLPDKTHPMMLGIKTSNQQFPSQHDYQFSLTLKKSKGGQIYETDAGPVGLAVNGIPIFNPGTQGTRNSATGNRPHTLDEGELDSCGGHAGRGDDYHYHIAPSCLIEQLGRTHVEEQKRPIGYAMDGFPILALGWFDKTQQVESQLDQCRGMIDENGQYFYNVMSTSKWDILNCLTLSPQKFARDRWRQRKDKKQRPIDGLPIQFAVAHYETAMFDQDYCYVLSGQLNNEQILLANGVTQRYSIKEGSIFHCNSQCYGLFFEADRKPEIKGRAIYYDLQTSQCPTSFNLDALMLYPAYNGPEQQYRSKKPPKPQTKKTKL